MLSSHLHLLYLVTPYDLAEAVRPCWIIYLQQVSVISFCLCACLRVQLCEPVDMPVDEQEVVKASFVQSELL